MTTTPTTTGRDLRALARRSVEVIEGNQAPSGAFPASPSFPVYRYSWFRDGSFIADALSRAGRVESAERFFAWCARVLVDRRDRIEGLVAARELGQPVERDALLPCRYTLDGRDGDDDWWDFQLDGYGTWLWALVAHGERHGRPLDPYRPAVDLCIRYLVAFHDEPCFDWWEEHGDERHVSTLAALYGGLTAWQSDSPAARSAARTIRAAVLRDGVREGRFVKWLGGDGLDASLIACATPFRLVDPAAPLMQATVAELERELAHGGVHRYAADTYYGGGEWLLLAALLGWHYAEVGRVEDAWAQLRWVAARATADGDLPEQVGPHLLAPDREQEWIDRWGPVATPLLWSHAMYLTLAVDLGVAL